MIFILFFSIFYAFLKILIKNRRTMLNNKYFFHRNLGIKNILLKISKNLKNNKKNSENNVILLKFILKIYKIF